MEFITDCENSMHIFMPEMIYNAVKDNENFIKIYKPLNDFFNSKMNCMVDYTYTIGESSHYIELENFLDNNLDKKLKKIWKCFKVNVDLDEINDQEKWKSSRKIIEECKEDDDLDVKMYAYYMELANTANHESEVWIENVEKSLKIFEENKDRTFDPRLYTKYYWDAHEKNSYYLKLNNEGSLIDHFKKYQELDLEIKSFLFSKNGFEYFRDIINHKTIYTVLLFWASINSNTLNNKEDAFYVLQKLDEKVAGLEFKYNSFNMHLMEWLWVIFKWHLDLNDKNSFLVFQKIIDIVEESLKNRPFVIRALEHHNFHYISNFLIFVQNLNEVEEIFEKISPTYKRRINQLNWTEKEYKVIVEKNVGITNNWWNERSRTLNNYKNNMISPVINKFLG